MKKRPCPSNITFLLDPLLGENLRSADDRNNYKYSPLMALRVIPVFRKFNSDLFRLQANFCVCSRGWDIWPLFHYNHFMSNTAKTLYFDVHTFIIDHPVVTPCHTLKASHITIVLIKISLLWSGVRTAYSRRWTHLLQTYRWRYQKDVLIPADQIVGHIYTY